MGHYRVKDTVNALLFRLAMLWQHGARWLDGSHSGVGLMVRAARPQPFPFPELAVGGISGIRQVEMSPSSALRM